MSEAYGQPGLRSLPHLPDLDQIVVALVTEYTSPKSRSSPARDVGLIPHRRGVSRCARPGRR
jgi:hypothetical protein